MNTAVAVVAALGSALAYAVASVLQHRSARTAPAGGGLHLRLVGHLAARPLWLAGLAVAIAALALHALALSLASIHRGVAIAGWLVSVLLPIAGFGSDGGRRIAAGACWSNAGGGMVGLSRWLLPFAVRRPRERVLAAEDGQGS